MAQITKIKSGNVLYDVCPSGDAIFNNTSYDNLEPEQFTSVDKLGNSETITSIFQKISKMFANIRWLKVVLDGKVSKSGDTITGDITIGATTIHSNGSITVNGTTINTDGSITIGGTTIASTGAITTNKDIKINSNGTISIGSTIINTDGSININNGTTIIGADGSVNIGGTTIGTDGTIDATSIDASSMSIETNHTNNPASKIVILGADGKYYYRSNSELLSDIGGGGSSSVEGTTLILP